jgi:hypothetical protein
LGPGEHYLTLNMRSLTMTGLLMLTCWIGSALAAQVPSDDSPIPYLSWNDLKALYPPKRHIGDWNFPKVKSLPHKDELIERCNQDLRLSLKVNPDPFHLHIPLPPGKLDLLTIVR